MSGIIAGFIASRQFFEPPKELFEDTEHWYDKELLEDHLGEIDRKMALRMQISQSIMLEDKDGKDDNDD